MVGTHVAILLLAMVVASPIVAVASAEERSFALVPEPPEKPAAAPPVILKADKSQYRAGEPIDVSVSIKNDTKVTVDFQLSALLNMSGLEVTGPDGKALSQVIRPVEISYRGEPRSIKPGESFTYEGMRGINQVPSNRYGHFPMDTPGLYRLRFSLQGLTSNILPIQVVAVENKRP